MKNIKISGDRQLGKSNILVDSIVTHVLDEGVKSDVKIVVTAPNQASRKTLQSLVAKVLHQKGVEFRSVIPIATGNGSITIQDKTITFLIPEMKYFIGRQIDYVFIDRSDMMEAGFTDFIDTIIKPFVIVVETQDRNQFPKLS